MMRKNIEELQKKVKEYADKEENSQSGGNCDHADEMKRMKDILNIFKLSEYVKTGSGYATRNETVQKRTIKKG